MTITALPAAGDVDLRNPAFERDDYDPPVELVDRYLALLAPTTDNPGWYWPLLVSLMAPTVDALSERHRRSCPDLGCGMCDAITELAAIIEADNEIQPSGCGCPDHRSYPFAAQVASAAAA